MSNSIFLIGMMGSGKSHTGQLLAKALGYPFQDLDDLIENTEGSKIAAIFDKHGEAYFRTLENRCLKSLGNKCPIVVATGGGAPCFLDNMNWMNQNGITIYLKTAPELLFSRLKNQTAERPLLRGRSEADLLAFITTKLAERSVFYEKAILMIEQKANGTGLLSDILAALKATENLSQNKNMIAK
jgi:shikimate kinase